MALVIILFHLAGNICQAASYRSRSGDFGRLLFLFYTGEEILIFLVYPIHTEKSQTSYSHSTLIIALHTTNFVHKKEVVNQIFLADKCDTDFYIILWKVNFIKGEYECD